MQANLDYAELVEQIEDARDAPSRDGVLRDICRMFGLNSAAYLGIGIPGAAPDLPFASVTYSNEWVLRYIQANYLAVDPVLREGTRTILPLDWSCFNETDPRVRQMFGEAREAGLGRCGLTIPIRGRHGEIALFSLTTNVSQGSWDAYKRRHLPSFQTIALYFHDLVLRSEGFPRHSPPLSIKEIDCLSWASRGKSFEDIAAILGLASRTVRFHLDLARHKLNALNVTHAVARAQAAGLIGPPD